MTDPQPAVDPAAPEDPEDPVDEILAGLLRGEASDRSRRLERACQDFPAHATVLRRRFALLLEAGLVEPNAFRIPETLGEFELLERIGQGGMGIVYRARQESLEREVAVKLVRPQELEFPGARERFAREVTTIARLSHPGIVPVYAVGEEGGLPYFAMELVRGETLAGLLEELADLPVDQRVGRDLDRALARVLGEDQEQEPAALFAGSWEQVALRVVAAVARALEHAHATGVVHRDLKPSNIMLTRDGRVMLLDFGLSSSEGSDRLTRTGAQVGSFAYMAPELLTGRGEGDRTSDVYALGVTLYELLAGQLPFHGKTLGALRERVLEASARALRHDRGTRRRISWELETVCLVAMDRDRERRYPGAAELAHDLGMVLEGRPIEARRPGLALRARRLAGRHPAWSAGLALVALSVPITWAVQERRGRLELGAAKARTDLANLELERSLAEVRRLQERVGANFNLAVGAVDRMLDRVGDEHLRDVPQMEKVRRDVLQDALAFHETLVEARPQDPQQRFEYARSLRRVGEIQALLSDYAASAEALERARGTLEGLIAESHGATEAQLFDELGHCLWRLVEARNYLGQLDEAVEAGRSAADVLAARPRSDAQGRLRLAQIEYQLARGLQRAGRFGEAREVLARSVDELREMRASGALAGEQLGVLATALRALGAPQAFVANEPGNVADDPECTGEALEIWRVLARDHPSSGNAFALAQTLIDMAGLESERSRHAQAVTLFEEALGVIDPLVSNYPGVSAYADAQAAAHLNLGNQNVWVGEDEQAESAYTRAVELYAALYRDLPGQRGIGVRYLIALQSLAGTRLRRARASSEDLATIDRSLALATDLEGLERGEGAAMVARIVRQLHVLRGEALAETGDLEGAAGEARRMAEATQATPKDVLVAAGLLAMCCTECGDDREARSEYALEAVDLVARALDGEPDRTTLENTLGRDAFDPLRDEAAFVELLESRGLGAWLQRGSAR